MKPRLLFVARTRYRLSLDASLAAKWDALDEAFETRVLAAAERSSPRSDGRFVLAGPVRPKALDGPLFYVRLPLRVARELRKRPADAVVAQSPYEGLGALVGRSLARSDAALVIEVHGDWRTFTRLYGSAARRLLSRVADALAAAALRRCDGIRTVSPYTSRLVRELGLEPDAEFAAYMDLDRFLAPVVPLPDVPQALFVGVLERYKNVDGLVEAWREVARATPSARLLIVGEGTLRPLVEELVAELPDRVAWRPRLSVPEVAAALDASSFLVLPSRSEGMGRVVVEAFCRGRPVLGARVGGIVDLVSDEESGLLVTPTPPEIAAAIRRLVSEPPLNERLGAGARASADALLVSPEEFTTRMVALVRGLRTG